MATHGASQAAGNGETEAGAAAFLEPLELLENTLMVRLGYALALVGDAGFAKPVAPGQFERDQTIFGRVANRVAAEVDEDLDDPSPVAMDRNDRLAAKFELNGPFFGLGLDEADRLAGQGGQIDHRSRIGGLVDDRTDDR